VDQSQFEMVKTKNAKFIVRAGISLSRSASVTIGWPFVNARAVRTHPRRKRSTLEITLKDG